MTDHPRSASLTVAEIADRVGGTVLGDPAQVIVGVGALDKATAAQISFLANPRYRRMLEQTCASAVLVDRQTPRESAPAEVTLIQVDDPSAALMDVVAHFAPPPIKMPAGVHPSAVVDPSATLGEGVSIGACAVISAGVNIGPRCVIYPGVYIGDETTLGEDCVLHANVVVRERVTIGDRVGVHAGSVIGSDGFGYNFVDGVHVKIPQIGTVEIADDVEIGAGCTIDRGRFDATRIGPGTKIDNLVQVAHNVTLGRGTLLIAQSGIAGSSEMCDYAVLAAQAGVVGHVTIGAGAMIAGKSGVTVDVAPGKKIAGMKGVEVREFMRREGAVRKLPRLIKQFKTMLERIEQLEAQAADDQTTG